MIKKTIKVGMRGFMYLVMGFIIFAVLAMTLQSIPGFEQVIKSLYTPLEASLVEVIQTIVVMLTLLLPVLWYFQGRSIVSAKRKSRAIMLVALTDVIIIMVQIAALIVFDNPQAALA